MTRSLTACVPARRLVRATVSASHAGSSEPDVDVQRGGCVVGRAKVTSGWLWPRQGGRLDLVEIHQDGRVVGPADGRTCLGESLYKIDVVALRLEAFLESLGEGGVWLNEQVSHRHPSI